MSPSRGPSRKREREAISAPPSHPPHRILLPLSHSLHVIPPHSHLLLAVPSFPSNRNRPSFCKSRFFRSMFFSSFSRMPLLPYFLWFYDHLLFLMFCHVFFCFWWRVWRDWLWFVKVCVRERFMLWVCKLCSGWMFWIWGFRGLGEECTFFLALCCAWLMTILICSVCWLRIWELHALLMAPFYFCRHALFGYLRSEGKNS